MEDNVMVVYSRETTIFAAVCAVLFCVVGVIGNFVTIVALSRSRKLRANATTAFVMSLCVSDLIFCSVNLPLTAIRYSKEEWTLGDCLCTLFPVFFYGNVAVSVLNLVAITVNRFVVISLNQYYNTLYSTVSIWLQLFATWFVAFSMMLPPLLGIWGQLGLDRRTFSCTILKDANGSSPKRVIFIVGFAIPCIIIILSYSCIYCRVQNSRKKLQSHKSKSEKSAADLRREKDDKRLTKLMLIIFICFVLCFLPLMIVNSFDKYLGDQQFPFLNVLASILAWMSSVINPFIYAVSNQQYRYAYAKLLNLVKTTVLFTESRNLSDGKTKSGPNKIYLPVSNPHVNNV